jgi:uncharacterized protein YeaO (DUF488 family)
MSEKLKLSTFQVGTPAQASQGLRVSVTRFPPRGVPKERWAADGYFDVWLPVLAPSAKLVGEIKKAVQGTALEQKKAFDRYERELLSNATGRQTLEFLAQVAARMPISIGCACEDESKCHRSRLYKIIQAHAPDARAWRESPSSPRCRAN